MRDASRWLRRASVMSVPLPRYPRNSPAVSNCGRPDIAQQMSSAPEVARTGSEVKVLRVLRISRESAFDSVVFVAIESEQRLDGLPQQRAAVLAHLPGNAVGDVVDPSRCVAGPEPAQSGVLVFAQQLIGLGAFVQTDGGGGACRRFTAPAPTKQPLDNSY